MCKSENIQLIFDWLTEDGCDLELGFDYDMDEHGHPTIEAYSVECKMKTLCGSGISLFVASRIDAVQLKILDGDSGAFIHDETFHYVDLFTSFGYLEWEGLFAKLEEVGIVPKEQQA